MAITFLKIKVINPTDRETTRSLLRVNFWWIPVYSVAPEGLLNKLGLRPTSYEEFILANGETIKKPMGNAYFEYKGEVRGGPVIFGEKGIFLLGATTLESLGMILDPIGRKLKPLPMLLM